MSDRLLIGTIVKSQGIKGQVKAIPLTNNAFRFNNLKKVYLDNVVYNVENIIIDNVASIFIKFSEVNDRNAAETLRNKKIEINREDAADLPVGTYFIVDIIDCKVVIDNDEIGKIYDVLTYGAADVYCIKLNDGKKAMFPALETTLLSTDIKSKTITLDRKSYEETVVFED